MEQSNLSSKEGFCVKAKIRPGTSEHEAQQFIDGSDDNNRLD